MKTEGSLCDRRKWSTLRPALTAAKASPSRAWRSPSLEASRRCGGLASVRASQVALVQTRPWREPPEGQPSALGSLDWGCRGGHDARSRATRRRCSDRKSTRLNSSHEWISYAVFCLKKKKQTHPLGNHYPQIQSSPNT